MWNQRRTRGTPFLVAYEQFLLDVRTDYREVRHENVTPDSLSHFFEGGEFSGAQFSNEQTFDVEGLKRKTVLVDDVRFARRTSNAPSHGDEP